MKSVEFSNIDAIKLYRFINDSKPEASRSNGVSSPPSVSKLLHLAKAIGSMTPSCPKLASLYSNELNQQLTDFMFLPHLSHSSVTGLIEVSKSSNGYLKFWWLWSVPGVVMESYLQPPHAIRLISPPAPHLSHLTEQRIMWVMRSHRFHETIGVVIAKVWTRIEGTKPDSAIGKLKMNHLFRTRMFA